MKKSNLKHFIFMGLLAISTATAAETAITIDGKDTGRIFEGIGALSAGASSRLLIDYPEPQRGEILDYLFKPNFGAALQINKVEIGGDMNSTDGSEPSHMRTRDDENYNRGYEWWLMEESKKRNPGVKLSGLQWGAPNWVNPTAKDIWTQDNITFLLNWVRGAKTHYNLTIDYMGGWNEKPGNPGWFVDFRKALDQAGFNKIQIVADDEFKWKAAGAMATNPEYAAAVQIIGSHYPGFSNAKTVDPNLLAAQQSGKPIWASEAGSYDYHDGAVGLAIYFNREYIDSKITSFINWSTVWSVFPGLPYSGCGLMMANTPWSGNYEVGKSIWSLAHTTQFAQPGWRYLDRACGYFGGNPDNGSYVTLAAPNHQDYSLIVETLKASGPQTATVTFAGGLSAGDLHVWKTDLRSKKTEDWFIKQPDLSPKDGSFTVTFLPGCVYSLTTTTGQAKGMTTPPPPAMLALPYHDDFKAYEIGKTPRYFSDQHGTFEVAASGGGRPGKSFRQTVTAKPVCWNYDADPTTVVGDPMWKNYQVSSDVLLEQPGYVDLIGRLLSTQTQNRALGYHLRLTDQGRWSLIGAYEPKQKTDPKEKVLASGTVASAAGVGKWHKLSLSFVGSQITAAIDDEVVADKIVDDNHRSGLVGLAAFRWQTAEYMNFRVVPLGDDPYVRFVDNLAKEGAQVLACDSQDPGHLAELAIDGNPETFWHTAWKPAPAPPPHFLTIDLGKPRTLQGLRLTHRQDRWGARVAECEVYLSNDATQWGDPVATVDLRTKTEMQSDSASRTIRFQAITTGRYLKVLIKSTQSVNDPAAAIAELGTIE